MSEVVSLTRTGGGVEGFAGKPLPSNDNFATWKDQNMTPCLWFGTRTFKTNLCQEVFKRLRVVGAGPRFVVRSPGEAGQSLLLGAAAHEQFGHHFRRYQSVRLTCKPHLIIC